MNNLDKIILIIATGQGILISSALIFSIFKKNYSNFFLGIIVFVITIELANFWAMTESYHHSGQKFPFWILGSYWLVPPALHYFFKVNNEANFKFDKKIISLFIPALIQIFLSFIVFYSNLNLGTNYHLIDIFLWFLFAEVLPVIAMIIVLINIAYKLKSLHKPQDKQLLKNKSNSFIKLLITFWIFVVITFLWIFQTLFQWEIFGLIKTVLFFLIFLLGYIGFIQPSFFQVYNPTKKHHIENEFLQYQDEKELIKLENLFSNEKIYTQQRLSLKQVAYELQLSERYLSNLINRYHQTNFNNYVNTFRVKDAIKRIQDPSERNKSLLGIALDVGFNSKSAFNKTFKELTGKKPSEFL